MVELRTDIRRLAKDLQRNGFSFVPLPGPLVEDALRLAQEFFVFDTQTQMSALASPSSGILGFHPSEDIAQTFGTGVAVPTLEGARARGYSSFDFVDEAIAGTSSVLRRNVWPSDGFASRALHVYYRISAESIRLSAELLEYLHGEGWVHETSDHFLRGSCCSIMRLLSYCVRSQSTIISKAHTDYELFSLVLTHEAGLQVKTPGGDWVYPQTGGSGACLIAGDMTEALTFGHIQSPLHRVRIEHGTRISVIFFQGLPLDTKLAYSRSGIECPKTFGAHILPLLARGSAHLRNHLDEIEKELGCSVPVSNLFKEGK